uniref:Uncharacterized protein n=1 Tax=Phaeomonas parva TaxID=124430 RepID=A0A7S1TXB2_9STRA|mmetsp:Transcript_22300/g.68803  ORF Transcript_22300/g.68803 Transcript_22300/m.68803 type:complete len:365 (+) Transcript_22300:158-1252(+)
MPPKAGLAAAVLVATASALCTPTPRRALIVEFDVLADTTSLESAVHLEALRRLRPQPKDAEELLPWWQNWEGEPGALPGHRWRTFDLSRKYARVLRELRVARPAEAVMLLRLLFEEDAVGRRAIAARNDPSGRRYPGGGWAPTKGALKGVRPGTRPLTAGEVVENWGDLLRERCEDTWRGEDGAEAADAIDAAVASLYDEHLRTAGPSPSPEELVQLEWRREVVEAVADARELVVTLRGDAGLGAAAARLGEQEEREAWSARLGEEGGLGPLRIEIIRSAADVVDLVDASLAAGPVTYVGASPLLTRGVTSALRQPLEGGALGVAHCAWPTRFDDGQELFGRVQGVHVAGVPGDLDQALAKAAA